MAIRSIPPTTVMRRLYPTGGSIPPAKNQRQNVYYKPTRNTPMPISAELLSVKEVELDVFNEDNVIKIIGNFSGTYSLMVYKLKQNGKAHLGQWMKNIVSRF